MEEAASAGRDDRKRSCEAGVTYGSGDTEVEKKVHYGDPMTQMCVAEGSVRAIADVGTCTCGRGGVMHCGRSAWVVGAQLQMSVRALVVVMA
jgi:hypothetical protein